MTIVAEQGVGTSWRSLELQRSEYRRRRFLAMPIAGTIAWSVVAIGGAVLPLWGAVWTLFIATGFIAYLGMGISKLTGEDFLDRTRPKNVFDGLFFHAVFQAVMVYSIAIPFFLEDPTSLPLTVGILSGLMWIPMSWILEHPVGIFHTTARTALVLVAWYALPQVRFVAVPAVIVAVYLATIVILELRWRQESAGASAA